jgi:hypothetical protein
MKKSSLILGLMVCGTFLFGNEFDGYEENHSFLEPVDMVQNIIDVRDDFSAVASFSSNLKSAKKNFSVLKNMTLIDAHRADDRRRVCTYESSSKNIIHAFFEKHKNRWILKNIRNSKRQKLDRKVKNSYELHESENCFYSFMDSFEEAYPNAGLRLIGRETKVDGIVLKKQGKVLEAHFSLSYLSLNQYHKSGWYLSKIELNKSSKKVVKNRKVALSKQGFLFKKVVPPLPNARLIPREDRRGMMLETKPMPKLKKMVCSDHQDKRYIRMVFTLDREKHIRKTFDRERFNNKLIRFHVDSKKAKIEQGNCHFLRVDSQYKLGLDLKMFQNEILNVKYGNLKNRKKSYMDLRY